MFKKSKKIFIMEGSKNNLIIMVKKYIKKINEYLVGKMKQSICTRDKTNKKLG